MAVGKGKRWLVVLAVAVIGGGGYFVLRGNAAHTEKNSTGEDSKAVADEKAAKSKTTEPIAVTVATVTGRKVQRSVELVGTFYGQEEVEIAAKLEGRVARILHDVGDRVKPGEPLLELDDTDYRLAVDEAQRSMELELAKLGLQKMPEGAVNLKDLPSVVRAQFQEKNARKKLERSQGLKQKGVVSQDELEQVQTDFDVAQATTREMLMQAEQTLATVRYRQAILETARQRLKDTTVVVPTPSSASASRVQSDRPIVLAHSTGKPAPEVEFSVAARLVSEGEQTAPMPPTVLFRLVIDQPLKLRATVPERHVAELKVGQPVKISVEAYPDEKFVGTVSRVNPTIDRVSRTFQIEVLVPNYERKLRAGSFAKANVLTREETDVRTIPEDALVTFAGVTKVFVVRDGLAQGIPVRPAERLELQGKDRLENWAEIIGDIPAGAQVVTSGHSQLANGTPVRIRTEGEPAVSSTR